MSPRLLYRTLAIAEAVTWTMLILGLVLKYVTDSTDLGVTIAGPIHGFVFLAYCAVAVLVGVNQRWSIGRIAVAVTCAIVPYATAVLDRILERRGLLDGPWRRDASGGPVDRMLRLVLTRPVLSVIVVAAAVVLAFSVLLVVGPPRLPD